MVKCILFQECVNCGKSLPLSTNYYKRILLNEQGDVGFDIKCNYCKAHKSQVNVVLRRAAFKNKLVESLGGKCQGCGNTYPSVVYDFHHIDPSQKQYSISKLISKYSKKNEILIYEEVDKCILLCANCHRKLHWENGY